MEGHQDLKGETIWEALAYHVSMLTDAARNRAFAAAVAATVKPGARVLDVGAGCGPWAILAAQHGAGRVVAIERNPAVVPLLTALVRDHGLADRIEIVVGDSRDVVIAGDDPRFDVIVSETIGSQAFDEGIVPIVVDARRRWLAPGGVIVPARVGLVAAPARRHFALGAPELGVGLPLHLERLRSLEQHFPAPTPPGCTLELLAPPVSLVDVDLHTVESEPSLDALSARFAIEDGSAIEGIAMWVAAELSPGVTLSSQTCPSWTQMFFPLDAFPAVGGELVWQLDNRPASVQWSASFADIEHVHSPHLARAWWHARTQTR